MTLRSRILARFGLVTASGIAFLALALGASQARSAPRGDDDDEDKAEARQVAKQAFVENCLMCHGEDMTSRQRLTAKQWTAEVEKMVSWGTPLPPDRKDGLIAYLSETYPPSKAAAPTERITPEAALALDRQDAPEAAPRVVRADPKRGESLFTQHCAVCHGPAARGGEIGINLVTTPILVREDEYRTTLHQGKRRMPSFAAVLDDKAQSDLLAWLRQAR